jgi:hypothetical protein
LRSHYGQFRGENEQLAAELYKSSFADGTPIAMSNAKRRPSLTSYSLGLQPSNHTSGVIEKKSISPLDGSKDYREDEKG